jgi:hypothetical protein
VEANRNGEEQKKGNGFQGIGAGSSDEEEDDDAASCRKSVEFISFYVFETTFNPIVGV